MQQQKNRLAIVSSAKLLFIVTLSTKKEMSTNSDSFKPTIFFCLPNGYSIGFHTAKSFVTTVGVRDGELVKYGLQVTCPCLFATALLLTSSILAAKFS